MSINAIRTYADKSGAFLVFTSVINPNYSTSFHAFLTSYSESFTSNWTEEMVYGRNDPIGTFQGTSRKLSLAWDIPSANAKKAKSNMKMISRLIHMLYPAYTTTRSVVQIDETDFTVGSNALTMAKAPLIKLRFANLITDQTTAAEFSTTAGALLGYVSSVSINPVLDMGMYTIGNDILLPKVYSISLDFTVLHQHDLGTDQLPARFPFTGID